MVLGIREMADDDEAAVVALWHTAGLTRPWNDVTRDIAFARGGTASAILVAEDAGTLAGTVMVGHDGHRGWVYYLAVLPSMRGRGIGSALLRQAEVWLRNRGVWKLNVMIRDDNVSALGFYDRLGYARSSVICLQKVLET